MTTTEHYPEHHRIDPPQFTHPYSWHKDPAVQKARDAERDAEREKLSIEREKAVQLFIQKYVPRGLGDTDKSLLKDPEAFEAALAKIAEKDYDTDLDRDGLFLYGPTGLGKTRCAVQSAATRIRQYGESVAWWSAYDLKQRLFALRNDADEKETFIGWLSDVDCSLYIDDLGHQVSESFLEVIRVVLENRGAYSCTIVTSQFSLDEFVERCAEKEMGRLGEAIARRLFESCRRIEFKRNRKPHAPRL